MVVNDEERVVGNVWFVKFFPIILGNLERWWGERL